MIIWVLLHPFGLLALLLCCLSVGGCVGLRDGALRDLISACEDHDIMLYFMYLHIQAHNDMIMGITASIRLVGSTALLPGKADNVADGKTDNTEFDDFSLSIPSPPLPPLSLSPLSNLGSLVRILLPSFQSYL